MSVTFVTATFESLLIISHSVWEKKEKSCHKTGFVEAMSIVSHVMAVLPNSGSLPVPHPITPHSPLRAHCISDWALQYFVQNGKRAQSSPDPHVRVRTTTSISSAAVKLAKWPLQLLHQATDYRLPKNVTRRISCVGTLPVARGYTAKCPCPQTFRSGQAALIWIICQQCQQW